LIKDNLASVQARINKVNHTQVVTLIAVSKTKSASDVQQAIDATTASIPSGETPDLVGSWSILTCNKTLSFPLLSGLWGNFC
jgi:uncharacterized pyridoxal phosphate-containing UPF0001 family protein